MHVKVPSNQDYEIYYSVEAWGQSQRATAEKFGIPVAKVREIIAEVRAFIVQQGSAKFLNVPPDKLELVALRRYVNELTHINKLLMRQIVAVQREAKAAVKAAAKKAKPPKSSARDTKAAASKKEPANLPVAPSCNRNGPPPLRTCMHRRRCGR